MKCESLGSHSTKGKGKEGVGFGWPLSCSPGFGSDSQLGLWDFSRHGAYANFPRNELTSLTSRAYNALMTTEPLPTCTDIYGYFRNCDDYVQPCYFGSTLYTGNECRPDNPPLGEWCLTHADHPVCPTVAVGEPPVLPSTGVSVGGSGLALALVAVGVIFLKVSRRKGCNSLT